MSKFDLMAGNDDLHIQPEPVTEPQGDWPAANGSVVIKKPHPIYWDPFWSLTSSVVFHHGGSSMRLLDHPDNNKYWVLDAYHKFNKGSSIVLETISQDQRDFDTHTIASSIYDTHTDMHRVTLSVEHV